MAGRWPCRIQLLFAPSPRALFREIASARRLAIATLSELLLPPLELGRAPLLLLTQGASVALLQLIPQPPRSLEAALEYLGLDTGWAA